MAIYYHDTPEFEEPLLRTAIVTQSEVMNTRHLLSYLISMPMMTIGVMVRIHLQAFKLWRKGARYHAVPPLPQQELTINKRFVIILLILFLPYKLQFKQFKDVF
jgi:DUF1365 family protein